jgi:protein phosphatase
VLDLDFSLLAKEALRVQSGVYIETVDNAISLLCKENGAVGNFTIENRLVKLEPKGEALVIGDLHGDLKSLTAILQESQFIRKMEKTKEETLIFLGDYGDRGDKSAETYYTVLKLKLAFPRQVILLRGNHEAPKDLLGYPHDLPIQFQNRFGKYWQEACEKTRALWNYLYNAVFLEDRYLMVHGGISPEISSLQDIAEAHENRGEALEDLLWSDPDEDIQGVASSPRGAGKLFGKDVTDTVLRRLNAEILIRGHEACDSGFKINHDGKILTLFSRKGAPYFNRSGTYLQLSLSEKPENGGQMVSWIHQF